jgi:neutral trehalase
MTEQIRRLGAGGLLLLFVATPIGIGCGGGSHWTEKKVEYPPPRLTVENRPEWAHWERGFSAVYDRLLRNLHLPNGFHETRYARPSPRFWGVYLWDSAFISQVWRPWDVQTARSVNRAVLAKADRGRLQHYVNRFLSSDRTQPPVMTWAVWQNYRWDRDKEALARAYPQLVAYHEWLFDHRRLDCGLFFWADPYESGMDNSPRFDAQDGSADLDTRQLAAVDLSSYVVLQSETLGKMARALGREAQAEHFSVQADRLSTLIDSLLWDDQSGVYFDRNVATGRLVDVKTVASLTPLFAGVPDSGRARRLRGHVLDSTSFHAAIPVPSVAMDEPAFEKDMWRGPTWVNTSFMVLEGLRRYGFDRAASELAYKLVDGVYRTYENTGDIAEFYDPNRYDFEELHRKEGNLWKRLTLGDSPRPNFVGWSGLTNTIVLEHLVGYQKRTGARWIAPSFPARASGLQFTLVLPAEGLAVELTVLDEGGVSGVLTAGGDTTRWRLKRGERMRIPD